MLHTKNSIIKHKAGLLNLVEELKNASRACIKILIRASGESKLRRSAAAIYCLD
jgi:hypothetical protein